VVTFNFTAEKGNGYARLPCPTRPTNPVNIAIDVAWAVVVYDVPYVWYIEATSRNVCGNKNTPGLSAEIPN
jgi:hypothetical protein